MLRLWPSILLFAFVEKKSAVQDGSHSNWPWSLASACVFDLAVLLMVYGHLAYDGAEEDKGDRIG